VELQRERAVRRHLVDVALLADAQRRAHPLDRLPFGERVERERVVPLERQPVPLVLDRPPLDQVPVGTAVDPVVHLLRRQAAELRKLPAVDPLGKAHPLLDPRQQVEVLRFEVGHHARDVVHHVREWTVETLIRCASATGAAGHEGL
jgi:hypothetical protein